jgi:hypothetical protein
MGYGMYRQGLADAKIVATPDLLQWHPEAIYVPIPQTPLEYHYEFDGRLKVLHAPTDRRLKGTDLILEAIDKTKEEGVPFDFTLVEGATHEELLERFSTTTLHDRVIAEVDGKPIGTMGLRPWKRCPLERSHHAHQRPVPPVLRGVSGHQRPANGAIIGIVSPGANCQARGHQGAWEKGAKYVARPGTPRLSPRCAAYIYEQVLARRGRPAGMV